MKVIFSTVGSVAFVVAIIAFCVFGFVKNPYDGSRVYVGCCCCKKVPDFEADRLKYGAKRNIDSCSSQEQIKENPMEENQKRIRTAANPAG